MKINGIINVMCCVCTRDWSPSVGNTTSVPENFSFPDTMSPGPVPNGPSRAIQSNAAHGQEVHQGNRGQHKRGAGVNRRDPYISTHDTTDHSAAGQGFSSGIALAGGDAVLDEESQEHLSTNLKTLTDRCAYCVVVLWSHFSVVALFRYILCTTDAVTLFCATQNK